MHPQSTIPQDDQTAQGRARVFLIVTLVVGIAVLTGAVFVMINEFLNHEELDAYPGIALFAGCFIIFLSGFVQRFGTIPSEDDVIM